MTRKPVSVSLASEQNTTNMKTVIYFLFATSVAMAGVTKPTNTLKDGNDVFTARMFSEVVKNNPGKSVVISAFSVLPPLAQLTLASEGPTHDELQNTIGFSDDEAIKTVFTDVSRDLRSIKGVTLKMANKIYVSEGSKLNEEFSAVSRDVFNSEVENVDFTNNVNAAKTINTWVEAQTNNRIKDLVSPDSLGPSTAAVLANAIYFKGSWSSKFNKDLTTDRDFYTSKDKTIKLPTMYKRADYKYGESAELQAQLIELPYEGEQSSLLIVLPREKDGITELQEKLQQPGLLEAAVKNMYETEVDVYLPKFKIETKTDLKDVLSKMGIEQLFTQAAQLTKLLKGESNLYVSSAVQKAFIEVNEEGAEAAAANVVFAVTRSGKIFFNRHVFKADRPFYYSLQVDNVVLFNGIFAN